MYAIIDVAGQQFKVEKGQKLYVHRLENKEGSDVNFDKVMLIDNEGKITIGEPLINGAFVEGKVLTHQKGDKVVVFKKKRRKGYKVKNGHRQQFSHIEILTINEKGAPKKAAAKAKPAEVKAEAAPKAKAAVKDEKPAAKKTTPKATPQAKEEKPAAAKTTKAATEKKPAAKKPAAKKPAASATKKETTAKKASTAKTTTAKPKAAPKKKADGDAK